MPKAIQKPKTELGKKLQGKLKPKQALWQGPEDPGPMGGITQSILGRYPGGCPERFRLKYVEGWERKRVFDHKIEYGHMWHCCEEELAHGGSISSCLGELKVYVKGLMDKYRFQQEEINHWYQTCMVQFPIYVEHWKKQPDVLKRTPLMQEQVFHVPYKLPSGRAVYLRGKFDSVDLIGGKGSGIYIQENKTKGDIDFEQMKRNLTFEIQTMFYVCALQAMKDDREPPTAHWQEQPIKGVRYNVIRRPFSGGKGSIRKHKAKTTKKDGNIPEESDESYYGRLRDIIMEPPEQGQDNYWFARWKVEISAADIQAFKTQFLDPCLENLCNDYGWWKVAYETGLNAFDNKSRHLHEVFGPRFNYHWRLPFGVYNQLMETGSTDMDELLNGNTVGFQRSTTLFEELA
jgi:hypothetical protein